MWKLLLLSIFLIGVFAVEDTYQNTPKAPIAQQPPQPPKAPYKPSQPSGVKNGTAYGKYYSGGDDNQEYDHGYHHPGHRIFRGFDVPLVDDYICDLDATILVVTNSDSPNAFVQASENAQAAPAAEAVPDNNYGRSKRYAYLPPPEYSPGADNYGPPRDYPPREYYGRDNNNDLYRDRYDPSAREYGPKPDYDFEHPNYGYGPGIVANADRLRCSVIAGNDEDSCTTCCQLSARRDRSISKLKIVGFLVDNNQLNYEAQSPTGEGYDSNYGDRKKRSDEPSAPVYGQEQSPPPAADVPTPDSDLRCVCCAPKRYRPFIFDRFFRRQHRYQHRGPY